MLCHRQYGQIIYNRKGVKEMKKKIMSVVVKVVGFALALTLSVGVPVQTAQAVHSSGRGSGTGISNVREHNEFIVWEYSYTGLRDVFINFKNGQGAAYKNVFLTYDGYTLEVYDWYTGKKLKTCGDCIWVR